MSWIIKVDRLYKQYQMGTRVNQTDTLYEKMVRQAKRLTTSKTQLEALEKDKVIVKTENDIVSPAQTEGLPPGYFWSLKDISFEVHPGERIGLIGQNGSGKSTLLKIMSRITAPTQGEFRYKGHLISLLEVGTGFHTELSGHDNIYLNAAINGMKRKQINEKFKDIVEFSELGEQIETPVKRYSSGMYMRLAFSVAAFLESEILLIDEVLAVGDAGFQKKCKEKMLQVANDGRTVIFVSHDMSAIESICNKTIEISHGQIVSTKDTRVVNELDNPAEIVIHRTEIQDSKAEFVLCCESSWRHDLKNAPNFGEYIRVLSCKSLNDATNVKAEYTVNENIHIEIEFEVIIKKFPLNVQIFVTTFSGIGVFCSIDNNAFQHADEVREVGVYTQRMTIPKELLNNGLYYLSAKITSPIDFSLEINLPNCLIIKIIDDKLPMGVRGNWRRDWPEVILRPQLEWEMNHIKPHSNSSSKLTYELVENNN